MLEKALEALKTFDWGADPKTLKPIEEAIVASHGDANARKDLETKLAALLGSDAPGAAKDYICRQLMLIGTSASVAALAALLTDKDLSHKARFALERNPASEAAAALRDSLEKVEGKLKVGVISSLGGRKDAASVAALGGLLANSDAEISCAAAHALGSIRSPEAAKALSQAKPASPQAKSAVTDATLACADALLAAGKKAEALVLYKAYVGADQPKHVRVGATRGMLACAGKSE